VQLPNKVVSLGLASFRVLIVKVANMTAILAHKVCLGIPLANKTLIDLVFHSYGNMLCDTTKGKQRGWP